MSEQIDPRNPEGMTIDAAIAWLTRENETVSITETVRDDPFPYAIIYIAEKGDESQWGFTPTEAMINLYYVLAHPEVNDE